MNLRSDSSPCQAALVLLLLLSVTDLQGAKLDLGPEHILVNETAVGIAERLLDEQAAAGDPKAGAGGIPVSKWTTGYSNRSWHYPLRAVVDLRGDCSLTDIYLYDANGSGEVVVEAGSPTGGWATLFTDPMSVYNQWRPHGVAVITRYLRITAKEVDVTPVEVVVYGTHTGPVEPFPGPQAHTRPTMDQFIGANVLHTDPVGRMEAVGTIRQYHNWSWDEGGNASDTYPGYPNNQNKWNPSYLGNWNFDLLLANMRRLGLAICPSKKECALWLVGGTNLESKPINKGLVGADPESPAVYIEHADHLFQYAARYGTTAVSAPLLKLAAGQPVLTGSGNLHYVENWNEQDKWWRGRESYFRPFEYAAMSSADADGHLGALGQAVGVRNADPSIRLVMAGTAAPSVDYIRAMKYWCDVHRGGDFAWDVINVHHYSNDAGSQGGGTTGISPEADGLRSRMEAIRAYRDRHLPGVEFWLSEFGYDTHPQSPQRAPAIGANSAEEVQGQWLVRSLLELAAAGVDRAHIFFMRDTDSQSATKYATSGLITDAASGFQAKRSWFYVFTMKRLLAGLRYAGEQNSGNPAVKVYRFQDDEETVRAYAVWCPTSGDVHVPDYALALAGPVSSATLVELVPSSTSGAATPLTISNGTVTVPVSERPVFVTIDNPPLGRGPDALVSVSPQMVVNESGLGDATLMFDEPATAQGVQYANGTGMPSTAWFPGWGAAYPASAYIDFGSVVPVTKIFLFDGANSGSLEVSVGEPGNWEVVSADPLMAYNAWSCHVIMRETRYLRFTKYNSAAINEVAIYTNSLLAKEFSPPVDGLWKAADIGTPVPGMATATATGFVIQGDGALDFWRWSDELHFVYRLHRGDFAVTARVDSVSPQSIASTGMIMARESLAPGAKSVRMGLLAANGVSLMWRSSNPGQSTEARLWGPKPPCWIRLVRTGGSFSAFHSVNGSSWTRLGAAVTLDLPDEILLGLGVASHLDDALATAEFSNLTID